MVSLGLAQHTTKKAMGIDTERGAVFMRIESKTIRHLEKHQGIAMDFHYLDVETGDEFDIRDFTDAMRGNVSRESIMFGDREAHKAAIRHAVAAGLRLRPELNTRPKRAKP